MYPTGCSYTNYHWGVNYYWGTGTTGTGVPVPNLVLKTLPVTFSLRKVPQREQVVREPMARVAAICSLKPQPIHDNQGNKNFAQAYLICSPLKRCVGEAIGGAVSLTGCRGSRKNLKTLPKTMLCTAQVF